MTKRIFRTFYPKLLNINNVFQRMSCIISQEEFGQRLLNYFVTVKGAAEVLKDMVSF